MPVSPRAGPDAAAGGGTARLDALGAGGVELSLHVRPGIAAPAIEDAATQAHQLFAAGGR